jgi:hypothetical protein
LQIIAATLPIQLLCSEIYVTEKLQRLSPEQISQLKNAFIKNKHPRFKKEFASSRHQPFGKTSDYERCVQNADLAKIAKLIKVLAMLLQTKVYLFWKSS